ncbi:type I restriction enzyme, S subunit [Albimonas donghaensis]|uniref:Type I restriction enzyme, S subunit n=1 Tax=Albimonas donghaensis TaxID=356660 RepID=A0A1H3CN15_9RHOB|nr:restriction endonuclease subunit S [Albimonas donghaensis]SDX55430.1 type I restriction enzyme, S subunit [Albimonas donghaensis]
MNHHGQRLGDYFTSRRERGADGLPTLSVTLDRGLVRRDSLDRKTDTNLAPHEHLRVRPGDIAYNMMRMWQGASGLACEEALVSPAYVVLAPRKNLDPLFASYLFKLPEMIHRFWAYSYGLTEDRLRLYFNDFKRIPCAIPPLPEQRKIAEILSTWDRAIETTEALLAAAKAQKRALMQTLLTGKRRFPEFEGQPWPERALEEIVTIKSGGTPSKASPENWDGDLPWLSAKDLKTHFLSDSEDHLTEAGARSAKIVPAGTILVLVRGMTLMKDFPVGITTRKVAFNQDVKALTPKPNVSGLFLSYALAARKAQFMKLVNTANHGTGRLDTGLMLAVPIGVPKPAEQDRIAVSLRACDEEIGIFDSQARTLRTEKSALMQQLLTGKRRVRV